VLLPATERELLAAATSDCVHNNPDIDNNPGIDNNLDIDNPDIERFFFLWLYSP
jgi:hypothetical protein